MISLATLGVFSLGSLVLALTPGSDMLYIATRSVAQGRSAGIVSALGIHAGVLVHILAAALGISALIAASVLAFSLLKFAGAAYLIYLGIRTFLTQSETFEVKAAEKTKLRAIFYQGLINNVLNPKAILFFLAFLPQFIDPTRGNVSSQIVFLGLIMILINLPIDLSIGFLGGVASQWLKQRQGVQRFGKWVTGSVFIGLGIATALTGSRK